MLERGHIHLGILLHAIQFKDCPFESLEVPPVALLAAYHLSIQLKTGKTIEVGTLAAYPLLLLDSGFVVRRTFDAVCRVAKLKPKVVMESRHIKTAATFVFLIKSRFMIAHDLRAFGPRQPILRLHGRT